MRISDWSSDVCSSDLAHRGDGGELPFDHGVENVGVGPDVEGFEPGADGFRTVVFAAHCPSTRLFASQGRPFASRDTIDFASDLGRLSTIMRCFRRSNFHLHSAWLRPVLSATTPEIGRAWGRE